jgi:hypothetical protein
MIRSPQQKQVAQQDTLALPAFIIEDLVRQRLRTNITRCVRRRRAGGCGRGVRRCCVACTVRSDAGFVCARAAAARAG